MAWPGETVAGDVGDGGVQDRPGDPERLLLLLIATLQGIATLVTSGRAQAEQVDPLITDAVALFTRGQR